MAKQAAAVQAVTEPTPRKGRGGHHGRSGAYSHLATREAREAAALAEAHFLSVVKLALHLRGLEYKDIAPAMGISPGTLADKLNGRSKVSIGEAAQMAAILEVRLGVLIDRSTPVGELMATDRR
jgi:ribosome-binding protein aMBF1 (putative translation factor)